MTTVTTPTETQVGQVLFGASAYSILQFLDEGTFGKVVRCKDLHTKETVAVKIIKDGSDEDAVPEVSILEEVSALGPDRINVVRFIEYFEDMERHCLVFEMLDMNLYDLIEAKNNEPLCLQEIRAIAKQLLVALDALKSLGIVHSDIKPDNIMAVDTQGQPLRVKLIDFGIALHASEATVGQVRQPIGYRAPEISLGLPFNEAIDTWGLGCILAFLYLADHLFQVDCEYQMMRSMVTVLGQPSEHLLREGIYADDFFCEDEASSDSEHPTWRLLTPEEYSAVCQDPEKPCSRTYQLRSLDNLLNVHPRKGAAEFTDRKVFVDLLKNLLHLERDKRIRPDEALRCPFITMSHLAERCFYRSYLTTARTVMDLVEPPADQVDPFEESSNTEDEGSDTVPSEDAPDSLDEGVYSDEEVSVPFMDDLTLESFDDFIDSFEEDPAGRTADRPLTTGTYVLYDADNLSLSSDGAQEKDASHHEPSTKLCCFRNNRVACLPDGSADRSADGSAGAPSVTPSSSGRCRKLLKRMRKFVRRVGETFCFCCRVED